MPDGLQFRLTNIYNADPSSDRPGDGLDAAMDACSTLPSILAGNFNLHHEDWAHISPTSHVRPQADRLISWAEQSSITLVSRHGEATHNLGGVIDLVWGSAQLAASRQLSSRVANDISIPSDHRVIRIVVPGNQGARYGRPGRSKLETMDKPRFLKAVTAALPALHAELAQCTTAATESQGPQTRLDAFASSFSVVLRTALDTSAKRSSGKGKGYSWWNSNCHAAGHTYHLARRHHEAALAAGLPGEREHGAADWAQRQLRNTVRKAERDFFQEKIAGAAQGESTSFECPSGHTL
jgi:hypothetical protein